MELGRLEAVEVRQVWEREARDFTPWLLENPDRLAESLGIDLDLTAAEHPVGGFSLDLVGEDLTNDCVLIVENQLEGTDHAHLGQLLTYAAGTGAGTIVWIATSFRDEHRQAIDWLNENTPPEIHFFGIEIRLVRIGASSPAPLLDVVAQPNDWQKQVREVARAERASGRDPLYLAFWARFLERVKSEYPSWTKRSHSTTDNWLNMPGPFQGTWLNPSFARGKRLRQELYIDTGDAEANKRLFDHLRAHREIMEAAYGGALDWEELPDKRACRIADYTDGWIQQQDRFEEFVDWFVDRGARLRAALAAAPPFVAE
jgi:hypothetical protein